jgi:hypothetical protein
MDTSKKDLYYIIAIAAVILLAAVTYWLGGKGNEIVSYISFASAIVSIILALVAIFYSIVQNVNSQQNIGEMKILVSEASRIMTEKAGTLAEHAVSIEESARQLLGSLAQKSVTTTTTPLASQTFPFDISDASEFLLVTLYYLVKCYERDKPMDLRFLAILGRDSTDEQEPSAIAKASFVFYGAGLLQTLQCFLGFESIIRNENMTVEIRKLPSGFKETILDVVDRQSKDDRYPKDRDRIERSIKKIDAHVEAARTE